MCVHPFLAVTDPVGEGILVVEGRLPDDAVPVVLRRFDSRKYVGIVTTGGKLSRGSFFSDFGSFAKLAAEALLQAGVPPDKIFAVPALPAVRDRTYSSAVAVRNWLSEGRTSTTKLDVVSMGPHARRSRLLFEMALGPEIEVGDRCPAANYLRPGRMVEKQHWDAYRDR